MKNDIIKELVYLERKMKKCKNLTAFSICRLELRSIINKIKENKRRKNG